VVQVKAQGLLVSVIAGWLRGGFTQANEQKKDASKIPVQSATYNFTSTWCFVLVIICWIRTQ
jgi:hypothetical protein